MTLWNKYEKKCYHIAGTERGEQKMIPATTTSPLHPSSNKTTWRLPFLSLISFCSTHNTITIIIFSIYQEKTQNLNTTRKLWVRGHFSLRQNSSMKCTSTLWFGLFSWDAQVSNFLPSGNNFFERNGQYLGKRKKAGGNCRPKRSNPSNCNNVEIMTMHYCLQSSNNFAHDCPLEQNERNVSKWGLGSLAQFRTIFYNITKETIYFGGKELLKDFDEDIFHRKMYYR